MEITKTDLIRAIESKFNSDALRQTVRSESNRLFTLLDAQGINDTDIRLQIGDAIFLTLLNKVNERQEGAMNEKAFEDFLEDISNAVSGVLKNKFSALGNVDIGQYLSAEIRESVNAVQSKASASWTERSVLLAIVKHLIDENDKLIKIYSDAHPEKTEPVKSSFVGFLKENVGSTLQHASLRKDELAKLFKDIQAVSPTDINNFNQLKKVLSVYLEQYKKEDKMDLGVSHFFKKGPVNGMITTVEEALARLELEMNSSRSDARSNQRLK